MGSELKLCKRVDRDSVRLDELVQLAEGDIGTAPLQAPGQARAQAGEVAACDWTADREDGRARAWRAHLGGDRSAAENSSARRAMSSALRDGLPLQMDNHRKDSGS
jgi:hypothetical protein